MKIRKILLLILIFSPNYLLGQTCIKSGYCSNSSVRTGPYSSSTFTYSGPGWITLASAIFGGQYVKCYVTKGNTYEFSTCGTFGGTNGASGTTFDPEITLFDVNWNPICFHDNYSSSSTCPKAPYLSWLNDPSTGFTGYVYVLVNNAWYGQCRIWTNSTVRLRWREISGCTPPSIPGISSAINKTSSSFDANWSYSSNATSYYIDVSSNSTFTNIVASGNLGNQNTVNVSGLDCNTTYWYRVKAINNCANSNFSNSSSVTTTNQTLSAPTIQSPTNVTSSSFVVNWSRVTGATSYYLEFATSSSFSTILASGNVGNVTSIPASDAACNTTYWYRIKAVNNCNPSGFSTANVTTKNITSLASPTLRNPSNITSSSFTVNWDKVADASYYYLGFSTNSNFTDTIAQGNFINNSITVSPLKGNTTYCYRVKAITSCNKESGYSSACTQTSNCTSTPATPTIQNPTNITSTSFTANWAKVTDAAFYFIEVHTNSTFTSLYGNGYFYNPPINVINLSNNTTYWYRVRAYNSCSAGGNFSNPISATTTSTCSPPNPPSIQNPTKQVTSGFTANWSSSSGATGYYLTVYSNSSYTSVVSNYNDLSVGNVQSYQVKGLNCNTTYYYMVKAGISCGKSSPSSVTSAKTGSCTSSPPSGNGIGSTNNTSKSDPIQIGTGTYKYVHNDFRIPVFNGALNFTRYYNSLNGSKNGPLGYGWSHSYSYSVENLSDTAWDVHYPDGHFTRFIPDTNGLISYPIYPGTYDSLVKEASGEFTMFTKYQTKYGFLNTGQLSEIIDLNGNKTLLTYLGDSLMKVEAPDGKTLIFDYDNSGRITSAKVNSGRICFFGYESNGDFIYSTSPNGDTIKFTYNSNHSILKVLNALGHIVVDNSYDGQNMVVGQKDAYGYNTAISYNSPSTGDATIITPDNNKEILHHDSFYRMTSTIDAIKNVTSVFYDENSNYDSVTNVLGQTSVFDFDKKGNLTLQILSGNRKLECTYNRFSLPLQKTDQLGKKTLFGYDLKGNLTSILLSDLSTRFFHYDSYGRLILAIDGVNDTTFFFYNSATYNLDSIRTPLGGIVQFFYDTDGRLTRIIDENGNQTIIRYDANDNIIRIIDANNDSLQYTYDADNQLIRFIDKKGFETQYGYDKKGRLIMRKNSMNGVDSFFYDVMNNRILWIDPLGQKTIYTYDSLNRRTSVTNFAGLTKYEYDHLGHLTKFTDPENHSLEINYNEANQISATVDALNRVNVLEYDNADNLRSLTNHRGYTKYYDYNSINKLIKVLDVGNENTHYDYDSMGQMKSLKDGNTHVQTFTHGKGGLLSNYEDGAGNDYSYEYDKVGNNTKINKPVGSITNQFDNLNRLTKQIISSGDTYEFGHDQNNNVTSAKNNTGTSRFYFDSLNRMYRYVDLFGNQVLFGFNAVGSITYIVYPGNDTVKYIYDKANRLWKVIDWKNRVFIYTYDSTGRVKRLLYPNGIHCDYRYDEIKRLIFKTTYWPNDSVLYGQEFDFPTDSTKLESRDGSVPAGIASQKTTNNYGDNDAIKSDSERTFTNDGNGSRTSDALNGDTIKYTWTTDQMLTSMTKGGVARNFKYDALGHRVERTEGTETTRYVLNLNSPISLVLQTTDGNGALRANYIYGIGLLESMDINDSALYYHFDANHNTVAISDENDSIKATYTYLPNGVLIAKTGTSNQPFTFLGEFGVERESDTCYYVRARYLDASKGLFLSKDPLFGDLFDPQSLNRYVYALNNPVEYYDVTGLTTADDDEGFWEKSGRLFMEGIYESFDIIYESFTDPETYKVALQIGLLIGTDGLFAEVNSAKGLVYTKSSLKIGQETHAAYKSGVANKITTFKEYRLPSGRRIDFLDIEKGIIYELKPYNPRSMSEGVKQLQMYLKELQSIPQFKGINWKVILDTY